MFPRSPIFRRALPLTIAAALFAAVLSPVAAAPAFAGPPTTSNEIFVSPSGSNGGSGTITSPYRTLEKARAVIRSMNARHALPKGGVTVTLRGGDYSRDTSFELTKQDSGTADSPIVYRAYPGEDVRLQGGKVLNGDSFTPAGTTGAGARLRPEVRAMVMGAPLKKISAGSSPGGSP